MSNEQHYIDALRKADERNLRLEARVAELEGAMRVIAIGKTQDDYVAGTENAGDICAGRLCRIARESLAAPTEQPSAAREGEQAR